MYIATITIMMPKNKDTIDKMPFLSENISSEFFCLFFKKDLSVFILGISPK